MKRQISFGEAARDELAEARLQLRSRSTQNAQEFDKAFRDTAKNTQTYPFSHAVWTRFGDLDIRRARISKFPYFLFYIVYPSVDFQTGEALDIVAFLACRHERQNDPNWGARDPFPSP